MTELLVEGRSLVKHFPLGSGRTVRAVDGVSFQINRGEFLGLVGESGCGKSSLGRMLLRLIEPTGGQVFFKGEDITACSPRAMIALRRSMQMIFQNPLGSFNPKIRLGSALTEVARYHGMGRAEGDERIAELLSYINLPGELLFRLPRELSGGQLQRLAIARSLITNPAFIVADEPVSALDISVQAQLLNLLCELRERFEMTMLFISHDIMVVKYLCDRVAVMYLGVLVEVAGAKELFENSLHPYTKALIAAAPRIDANRNEKRELLEGDPLASIDASPGCPFAPRCRYCQERCRREKPELVERVTDHWVACFTTELRDALK